MLMSHTHTHMDDDTPQWIQDAKKTLSSTRDSSSSIPPLTRDKLSSLLVSLRAVERAVEDLLVDKEGGDEKRPSGSVRSLETGKARMKR